MGGDLSLEVLKMTQIIDRLKEIQEKENKRRSQAVVYLEKLEKELAPIFADILGKPEGPEGEYVGECLWIPIFRKESGKYEAKYSSLYFRYGKYVTDTRDEYIGFYIEQGYSYPIWGTALTGIRGKDFWKHLKQITDWLTDYLPQWIEQHDQSRDQRFEQIEKIAQVLKDE
jgi:hypothetical protein